MIKFLVSSAFFFFGVGCIVYSTQPHVQGSERTNARGWAVTLGVVGLFVIFAL